MSHDRSWWYEKANAYAAGWRGAFGADPSLANVCLGLSVAAHETDCGNAWPDEHNWGAVQLRAVNADELAVLAAAGLEPPPVKREGAESLGETIARVVDAARTALAVAIVGGKILPETRGALHLDSSPVHARGWYFVFFRRFDDDASGARVFVDTLATHRSACRVVLEAPRDLSAASSRWTAASQLAQAMYATRYFEGVHDPAKPGGKQANVDDYAKALAAELAVCVPALADWTPGAEAPADELACKRR